MGGGAAVGSPGAAVGPLVVVGSRSDRQRHGGIGTLGGRGIGSGAGMGAGLRELSHRKMSK
jgi:hypothetical protein